MFKFELCITLAAALSSPLSALADIDWCFNSNIPGSKGPLSYIDFNASPLTMSSPQSRDEIDFVGSAYHSAETATVEMNSLLIAMDSDWTDGTSLPDQDAVNDFDDLYTNPSTWLIKVYLEKIHSNQWNETIAAMHLNVSSAVEANDTLERNANPISKHPGWALLIVALIGWNLGRRFQNQQGATDRVLTLPEN